MPKPTPPIPVVDDFKFSGPGAIRRVLDALRNWRNPGAKGWGDYLFNHPMDGVDPSSDLWKWVVPDHVAVAASNAYAAGIEVVIQISDSAPYKHLSGMSRATAASAEEHLRNMEQYLIQTHGQKITRYVMPVLLSALVYYREFGGTGDGNEEEEGEADDEYEEYMVKKAAAKAAKEAAAEKRLILSQQKKKKKPPRGAY